MLVLSRKFNESIVIGDNVTVTVVGIRGDKVRLGVEAPRTLPVHRREVAEAIANDAAVAQPVPVNHSYIVVGTGLIGLVVEATSLIEAITKAEAAANRTSLKSWRAQSADRVGVVGDPSTVDLLNDHLATLQREGVMLVGGLA